ncbi:hypothetical protein FOZ60_007521 [Perkinsus olseni]|uniref:Eukaryotic translation initiation factor 3 subunit G n=1 Tax=Perkinsus olseni TaxID=32597 RepID=A0A7J6PMS1_PEROL|nr:hypothetical protein FOZ60_007521 [Perkinsus olseni]
MTTGRWADEDPISPSNRDVPPKSETDIDPETGLKTITEYEERDGAVYKINRVVKVTTVRVTCSKAEADRRRRWTPFGKAVETKKNNTFANRTEDEINLEPSKLTGASAAAEDETGDDQEKFWSASVDQVLGLNKKKVSVWTKFRGESEGEGDGEGEKEAIPLRVHTAGRYVPPNQRGLGGGARPFDQQKDRDEHTLRVSNLSEDVGDGDLQQLFSTAGRVQRIYLARNPETGLSKGFAFVTYYNKRDAEKALEKLNGHGYDNLILKLDWAKPAQPRGDRPLPNVVIPVQPLEVQFLLLQLLYVSSPEFPQSWRPSPRSSGDGGVSTAAPVVTPDASKIDNDWYETTAPLVSSSTSSQSGPLMIGIAGGTASGKTEIAMEIASQLNLHEDLEVIHQSSFYKDARAYPEVNDENYNFDHPDAFDYDLMIRTLLDLKKGRNVFIPHYDMRSRLRNDKARKVSGVHVVIFEGIFAIYWEAVRDLLDLRLFIHCDDDTRLARRLVRDVRGMGESVDSVISKYLTTIKLSHERYLKPCMKYADLIIPDGVENVIALQAIVQVIRLQLMARGLLSFHRTLADVVIGGRRSLSLRPYYRYGRHDAGLCAGGPHDDEPQLMIHELKSSDESAISMASCLLGSLLHPDHSESVVYASLIGYGDVMESGVKQHDRLCSFGKLTVPRAQLTARRHFLASGTLAPHSISLGGASPASSATAGSECNLQLGTTPKFAEPAPLQLPGPAMTGSSPCCSPVRGNVTLDGSSSTSFASSPPLVEVVYLPTKAQNSVSRQQL